jgi:hypothetical protein
MKKITSLLLVFGMIGFGGFFFSSCDETNLLEFDFNFNSADITFEVDQTQQSGTIQLVETIIKTNLDSIMDANNASIDKIETIYLTKCVFTIQGPEAQTFDILSNISASVTTTDLGQVMIAEGFKSKTAKSAELNVSPNVELTNYLKKETFVFTATGVTTAPIPEPVQMQAKLTYKVKVKL